MNIQALVNFLAPYLPFLMGLGQKAVEKGAEAVGEQGVKKLWDKLSPKVQAKPAALEAAEDVAKDPEDPDAVAALRHQLKKILEAPENADLAAEVAAILQEVEEKAEIQVQQEVRGHQNQVIGVVQGGSVSYRGGLIDAAKDWQDSEEFAQELDKIVRKRD